MGDSSDPPHESAGLLAYERAKQELEQLLGREPPAEALADLQNLHNLGEEVEDQNQDEEEAWGGEEAGDGTRRWQEEWTFTEEGGTTFGGLSPDFRASLLGTGGGAGVMEGFGSSESASGTTAGHYYDTTADGNDTRAEPWYRFANPDLFPELRDEDKEEANAVGDDKAVAADLEGGGLDLAEARRELTELLSARQDGAGLALPPELAELLGALHGGDDAENEGVDEKDLSGPAGLQGGGAQRRASSEKRGEEPEDYDEEEKRERMERFRGYQWNKGDGTLEPLTLLAASAERHLADLPADLHDLVANPNSKPQQLASKRNPAALAAQRTAKQRLQGERQARQAEAQFAAEADRLAGAVKDAEDQRKVDMLQKQTSARLARKKQEDRERTQALAQERSRAEEKKRANQEKAAFAHETVVERVAQKRAEHQNLMLDILESVKEAQRDRDEESRARAEELQRACQTRDFSQCRHRVNCKQLNVFRRLQPEEEATVHGPPGAVRGAGGASRAVLRGAVAARPGGGAEGGRGAEGGAVGRRTGGVGGGNEQADGAESSSTALALLPGDKPPLRALPLPGLTLPAQDEVGEAASRGSEADGMKPGLPPAARPRPGGLRGAAIEAAMKEMELGPKSKDTTVARAKAVASAPAKRTPRLWREPAPSKGAAAPKKAAVATAAPERRGSSASATRETNGDWSYRPKIDDKPVPLEQMPAQISARRQLAKSKFPEVFSKERVDD